MRAVVSPAKAPSVEKWRENGKRERNPPLPIPQPTGKTKETSAVERGRAEQGTARIGKLRGGSLGPGSLVGNTAKKNRRAKRAERVLERGRGRVSPYSPLRSLVPGYRGGGNLI